jgi:hypothetical protein
VGGKGSWGNSGSRLNNRINPPLGAAVIGWIDHIIEQEEKENNKCEYHIKLTVYWSAYTDVQMLLQLQGNACVSNSNITLAIKTIKLLYNPKK